MFADFKYIVPVRPGFSAEREPGNSEDPFALKRVGETVGLVRYPRFHGRSNTVQNGHPFRMSLACA